VGPAHRRACGGVGGLRAAALAAGTAQADGDVDAADFVEGVGVAAVDGISFGVGPGDDLVVLFRAVGCGDRLALITVVRQGLLEAECYLNCPLDHLNLIEGSRLRIC